MSHEKCLAEVSYSLSSQNRLSLGPEGGTPKKLSMGVRPASQNHCPIYDQNLRFSPNQKFDILFMTWLLETAKG